MDLSLFLVDPLYDTSAGTALDMSHSFSQFMEASQAPAMVEEEVLGFGSDFDDDNDDNDGVGAADAEQSNIEVGGCRGNRRKKKSNQFAVRVLFLFVNQKHLVLLQPSARLQRNPLSGARSRLVPTSQVSRKEQQLE